MRTLLISALALIMGYPAFAKDEHHDWKYRSHREQRPEIYWENDDYESRDWEQPRYEHRNRAQYRYGHRRYRGPRYLEREVIVVPPEPTVIYVRPRPVPPPPVGVHVWFGF